MLPLLPFEFEWDDNKCQRTLQDRGFDFGFASQAFSDPEAFRERDTRLEHGEDRVRLYGQIQKKFVVVFYIERQGRLRIISTRRANSREIQAHRQRRTNASDA
ncbi:BrnT family toxin [Synechococcus sp. CBW1006]|uniref:BrnT family toxin n=1 Tax=Synechococcus sp. CBW1006 TaxID=1353138 RepID=UPI0018CCF791|nr:BrnT family toxin [Synechococcus sp. CBW1006]